jgi:peptide/nickel transport system substrate-binding protein
MNLITDIKRRFLFPTLTTLIIVVLLSGCMNTPVPSSSTQSPSSPEKNASVTALGGKLRVGIAREFSTMDPARSTSLIDEEMYNNIYDPLVKLTPEGKFNPVWQRNGRLAKTAKPIPLN